LGNKEYDHPTITGLVVGSSRTPNITRGIIQEARESSSSVEKEEN